MYTLSPQAYYKIEQHLVAGSKKQVKRTKSPCLALDIGVNLESAEHLKIEKKWRVLSTLPLEKIRECLALKPWRKWRVLSTILGQNWRVLSTMPWRT